MSSLIRSRININLIETGIITILLLASTYRGMVGFSGSMVALTHAGTLLGTYVLIRNILQTFPPFFGSLFFAGSVLLLTLEVIIQQFTGLHLNWFVLSLMLEANSSQNTGIPFTGLLTILGVMLIFIIYLSKKFRRDNGLHIKLLTILMLTIGSIALGQLTYSVAFFGGRAEIMQAKRNLPFFIAPHPYYLRRIISLFDKPRRETPFSDAQIERQNINYAASPVSVIPNTANKPNILFIITDSVRASELEAFPELATSFLSAGKEGWLSLDQYSVSNCTHFSFYTMFTGRIATTFGEARQQANASGIIVDLMKAGYAATTSESISLDWYDIEKTILSEQVARWLPSGDIEDHSIRDTRVTENTIEQIGNWNENSSPRVHITYLNGSHFPYGAAINNAGDTPQERYHATIREFDKNLSKIFGALRDNNQLNNTIVIVTSDHGEEISDEDRIGHGGVLNDLQIRVPILVIGGNENTKNIRSHADLKPFILNQLSPDTYEFSRQKTVYLAGCDYDHPRDFRVITQNGVFNFDYNDGYLAALNKNERGTIEAARLLLKTIQSGGFPAQQ